LRTVIVHYHIFKNAGSSLDRILQDSFGDSWASLEGTTPTSLLRAHDLSAFVKDHPTVQAISSHLLRPPAPAGLNVLPVVLIRHPLDRAFSVYSQLRRNPLSSLPSEEAARQSDFPQFVRWCLDNRSLGGMVIANYQVIHLSPASFRCVHIYDATATSDDLRHVINYLSGEPCFGVVNAFDSTVSRLRQRVESMGMSLSPIAVNENITAGRAHSLEDRLALAQDELGQDLFERFVCENELDYNLYDWVGRHVI